MEAMGLLTPVAHAHAAHRETTFLVVRVVIVMLSRKGQLTERDRKIADQIASSVGRSKQMMYCRTCLILKVDIRV